MFNHLSSAFCALAMCLASHSSADVIAGPIVNPANGHQYYLLETACWFDSENQAVDLGGHLVTINDACEQAWVFQTFGSYAGVNRSLWIGLSDTSGSFVWASGETPAYSNWYPGEPNNANGEYFAHMIKLGNGYGALAGYWNDLNCPSDPAQYFAPLQGVVEVGAPEVLAADLNGDGQVNGADLGILLGAWGGPASDLTCDGTTDGADLGILLSAWTG